MNNYLFIAIITTINIVLFHSTGSRLAAQDRVRNDRFFEITPSPSLPNPQVRMTIKDNIRHIYANGIPNHPTGQFPNRRNPNTISEQQYHFMIPLNPIVSSTPQPVGMAFFGIANNGIPFESGTNEWWQGNRQSGWRIEADTGFTDLGLDMNRAHVQPNGAYHYHGIPRTWLKELDRQSSVKIPRHLGWAADGYPIYNQLGYSNPMNSQSKLKLLQPSYQLKTGTRPDAPDGPGGLFDGRYEQDFIYIAESGDLDKFNGRFGVTPQFPQGTYYYVVTDTFPNVSRDWKGVPDKSFKTKGSSSRRGPPPRRPGHRPRPSRHRGGY